LSGWSLSGVVAEAESALNGLAAADLDQDGDLDLVAWSTQAREVQSFINGGFASGGAGAWRLAARTSTALRPIHAALGDLNGDGIPDLMAGVDSDPPGPQYAVLGSLFVWKGTGNGSFAAWYRLEEIGNQVSGIIARDLDGDLDLDLALILGQYLVLYLNPGDGGLRPGGVLNPEDGPRFLASLDFDGDGDEDLALLSAFPWSYHRRIFIYSNEGGGAYAPAAYHDPASGSIELAGMAAGDWDEDGDQDLAVLGQWLHTIDRFPDRYQDAVRLVLNDLYPADYTDKDKNGVLDACQGYFYRGDMNGDGRSDVSDAAFLNAYLFLGGRPIPPPDYPGTGSEDPPRSCGRDPEGGDLGCTAYPACRAIGF